MTTIITKQNEIVGPLDAGPQEEGWCPLIFWDDTLLDEMIEQAAPCPICGNKPVFNIRLDAPLDEVEIEARCSNKSHETFGMRYRYYKGLPDDLAISQVIGFWSGSCRDYQAQLLPGIAGDLDELLFGGE